jgi:hypothetical protein
MLLPAAVYFGALLLATTFPRMVCVSGQRLRLATGRESMSFCWAQVSIFVPMIVAFVMILQMRWSPSVTVLIHAVFGGIPVLSVAVALRRLWLVMRAR